VDVPRDDDAPDDPTGGRDRWALTAQLPPEPGQPTPTLVTVRVLDAAEFAEVEAANARLRRFTGGSPYQRLHQVFRLLGQHAQRARVRAARVPQPPLQGETAQVDRAVTATLTAAEALLGSMVNDIATDHGQQSQQAVTMREAVDQARGSLVVALSGPLLALANTEPSLVEMRDLSSDRGPSDGEDGGEGREPVWEPVLRESVVTALVGAVGPIAAPLTNAPVRIVPLLQDLTVACQHLFARYLLLQEDRIAAASLRIRRLAAEVLDGAPVLMLTRGDPTQPQMKFRELALDEVRVLQRALRQARRLLAPPVTPPKPPPAASQEGPATAAPSESEVKEEPTDHPPTGERTATGGGEAEGASMASAVDLLAVVEHASRLTVAAERAWSAALDPAALDEANRELLDDQWSSVMAVIRRQAELSSHALEAAGLDATVDQFPPDVPQLLALDLDPDLERRRRQLQLAQFYALDQLLTALQGLRHPSRAALDPRTGQATQTWWDSGAFALVGARARHLARVTLALLNAEHAAIAAAAGEAATAPGQAPPPAQPPPWWAHLQLGAEALRRGDMEATLLHGYVALTARFTDVPSLADAVAAPFGDEAEGEAAKTLVSKLEEAIARLAAGTDVDLGVTVPLAHALLPLIERLLLPAPITPTQSPRAVGAADDPGSAAPPGHPSDADPNAPQAGK
jgi:hypothetical protein